MKLITVSPAILISLAIIVTFSGTASAATFEQFFDAILKAVIKSKGDLIDPLAIDDKNTTLPSAKFILPAPIKLNLQFTNNQLWGMKSLTRSGAAVQSMDFKNDKVTRIQLNVSPLLLTSDLNLTTSVFFTKLPPQLVRINATIDSFDFMIELVANKTRKEIKVNTFVIDKLNNLNVNYYRESSFFGREFKDYILTHVTKVVTVLFKKQVTEKVEVTTKNIMQEKIDSLPDNIKRLLYG